MNCHKCNHVNLDDTVHCISCGAQLQPYNNADLMERENKAAMDDFTATYYDAEEKPPPTRNNGGETDYYAIPSDFTTHQDVIEQRQMNYAQGNIYKVACTFNVGRHSATDYERELNKIEFFVNRERERIRCES